MHGSEVSSVGEKEWYFFCKRGRKYRNSIRPNRVTQSGFWKATGIDKPIYSSSSSSSYVNNNNKEDECVIGLKKSLVYYRGSAGKGTKTDWMMHEFRLPPLNNANTATNNPQSNDLQQEAEVWTLCRILKRIPSYKKYTPSLKDSKPNQTNSSTSKTCSFESDNTNPYLTFTNSVVIQQNETKPVIGHVDQRNHFFLTQPPTTLSYPTFWNQNVDDVLANENWDDLRSVVQFAMDPSNDYYGCK
ncbi:unnamed protein product [Lupinus luteus]|uniref:NAC domain-containing protein n=1 Tax=Lupinus luteus TaxID=3873 RepID=A0AAV1WE62_LUPLU